jgi:UrcA family protein
MVAQRKSRMATRPSDMQTKGPIMRKTLLAALVVLAVPGTAAAATPGIQTVSVDVNYADLNLQGAAGAETLSRRLEAAVNAVCARPSISRDLKGMKAWQDCRDAARSQAQRQAAPVVAYGKVTVSDNRY